MTQQQQQQRRPRTRRTDTASGEWMEQRLADLANSFTRLETVVEKVVNAQEKQQEYIDALAHRINQPKDWVSIASLVVVLVGGGVSFTMLMTTPLDKQGAANEAAISGIQDVLRERARYIGQDSARIEFLRDRSRHHDERLHNVEQELAYARGRLESLHELVHQRFMLEGG